MATKTFLDICQQVVSDSGATGPITSTVSQPGELGRIVGWVARAVTEIEGRWFNWNFLHEFQTITLIVGVRDYPPASNLNFWDNSTFSILDFEQRLDFIDWNRAKTIVTTPEDGDPHTLTILPSKAVRFYDTPTQILTINAQYWRKATALVNNLDEPSIPEQFRDVIVYKALQYYANFESADESKIAGMEQFAPRMEQLMSSELPAHQASGNINTGTDVVVQVPSDLGFYGDGDGFGSSFGGRF